MKKILYSVFALAIAAFTFTSCEDVPAPYDTPQGGQGGQDLPEGVYIDQSFLNSLGDFNSISESGELEWYHDYSSAMVTGYQDFDGDNVKENKPGVTWFVSPEIDLTEAEKAYLTVNMALCYERGDINENNSILISKDYKGDVTTATWQQLTYNTDGLNGDDFEFIDKSMNIPSDYIGGKVVVAFRHTCAERSSTWEVKSLKIQEGEVEETPDTPDVPEDGVILDQDFTSTLGDFTSVSASGTLKWYNDFKSAMCTGYQDFDGDGQKENQAGVTYFISPELSLSGIESAYMTINHAINYEKGDLNENNSILISKDYKGDVNAATWEQLTYNTAGLGSSFTFVENNINIPVEYLGSNVVIAFRHTCNDSFSSTWEVKSIKVQEGKAEDVEEPGGDDEPIIGGEVSGNSVIVKANGFGLEDKTELSTLTLVDGTTLTFAKNDGRTAPAFYTLGSGSFRMYPSNTLTINSTKTIESVDVTCDEYNGTTYNASGDISTSAGTISVDGAAVTVTGVSANSLTLTNTSATTGAPSQIRIVELTINYAE